jgi:hypothetical protein
MRTSDFLKYVKELYEERPHLSLESYFDLAEIDFVKDVAKARELAWKQVHLEKWDNLLALALLKLEDLEVDA